MHGAHSTCHPPPTTYHLPPPRARPGWIRENFDNIRLNEHQRINHFRNHYELTRKDSMIKNLKRAQRALQREGLDEEAAKYDFSPTTYVLPADYGLFVEEFKNHVGAFWIMKPIGGANPNPNPNPNSNPKP